MKIELTIGKLKNEPWISSYQISRKWAYFRPDLLFRLIWSKSALLMLSVGANRALCDLGAHICAIIQPAVIVCRRIEVPGCADRWGGGSGKQIAKLHIIAALEWKLPFYKSESKILPMTEICSFEMDFCNSFSVRQENEKITFQ